MGPDGRVHAVARYPHDMPRIAAFNTFQPVDVSMGINVFVLTGAGISAESGIPTFRDAGGVWTTTKLDDVAVAGAFERDPVKVWSFVSSRRPPIAKAQPNAAHHALYAVERHIADWLFICTQNIDDLHERAGSSVVHMHGRVFSARCTKECGAASVEDRLERSTAAELPRCSNCGALLRPDVVMFGEMPHELLRIHAALAVCDVFIAIGTSGVVEPASTFVSGLRTRPTPPRLIWVGPETPENAEGFDEVRLGTAVQVVPSLFALQGTSASDE
jgi:NAD-dependent deacetylase